MDDNETQLGLIQLELVVRAAALPGDQQVLQYPSYCDASYEVASDYDHWCKWALTGRTAPALTSEQRSSLVALDHHLDLMSGPHNAELWSDEALLHHDDWKKVRALARDVMEAFGWSFDVKAVSGDS